MAVVRAYAYLLSGRPAQALKACLATDAARLDACTLTSMKNACMLWRDSASFSQPCGLIMHRA